MAAINSPQDILAMSRGFMETRILLTAAELDLFTHLKTSLSASDLAQRTGYHVRPLTILLDALAAIGLVEKNDGIYQTPANLIPILSSDSPTSALPMILHAATLWNTWSHLTDIVAETGESPQIKGPFKDENALKAFIGAMHVVGSRLADQVIEVVGADGIHNLLDVGGASGTYVMAFLKKYPNLRATIFDLPPVIEMARERLTQEGLLDRVSLVVGDFREDELPKGYDMALLSAIIHMNSLEQNAELYGKIYDALDPGGRLVIRDHVMQPDRTDPKAGAIFAVNMLAGTKGGGTWTYEEIENGLTQAGFEKIRLIKDGGNMQGLVEAFKP